MISNESAYQQQDEPEMAMESMVQKRYMGQQTFSYMWILYAVQEHAMHSVGWIIASVKLTLLT